MYVPQFHGGVTLKPRRNVITHFKVQRYRCKGCGRSFVDCPFWVPEDSPLIMYRLRAHETDIMAAMREYKEGKSIRQIAKELSKKPETIARWVKRREGREPNGLA